MGVVAEKHADKVVITDDNPRTESPSSIRSEIIKYCPKASEIENREKALYHCVNSLQKGDILVIAGKGHETSQTIENTVIAYSCLLYTSPSPRDS